MSSTLESLVNSDAILRMISVGRSWNFAGVILARNAVRVSVDFVKFKG